MNIFNPFIYWDLYFFKNINSKKSIVEKPKKFVINDNFSIRWMSSSKTLPLIKFTMWIKTKLDKVNGIK